MATDFATPTDDLSALLADVEMVNPTAAADTEVEADELEALFASEEVIEEPTEDAAVADDASLEEAVAAAEREEAYAVADKPAPEVVQVADDKPVKAKKERKAKEKALAEEPKAKRERVYFGPDKVRRLRANLGDKLGDFMVLTIDDASLPDDLLKAKQDETLQIIESMGVKVKARAALLIEFAAGRTARLNNVIATALRILAKDGQITAGDQGNLFKTLLAKPYTPAAARAMGNNTVNMLRQLKLINEESKQTFVPNPQSLLLAFVTEKMGLSFGELDEGDATDEVEEIVASAELEAAEV